jgi:uncharacterized repeat protein (TIGR03847 family)
MPNQEYELNPVEFITIGTVGPKGQRVFHLQAGSSSEMLTLTIEKEQARALSDAIVELLDDLSRRFPERTPSPPRSTSMDLRDPVESRFRVAQMGLGYDEERDMIVLVASELVVPSATSIPGWLQDVIEGEDDTDSEAEFTLESDEGEDGEAPDVVRMWCTRAQMRALSDHASHIVQAGRADPRQNGRLVYYWT